MINLIIQYSFVLFLLLLLALYGFIIYAARRASSQTSIPIPIGWERMMGVTLVLIVLSLMFTLIIRP